ncbi:hypothetical protein [Streptomyces sp. TRM68367]|uniref:hypothetical protein n=1 Tax=Streptomyces sp. TRM68367 TaxID=2758415 RepID=UPI00165C6736|nr:hypothetical protein [Streptomyces sp. TRM68367]MBC9729245.1 hypothetical protein [Streptomyces sp. TRM68367]
MQVTHIPEGAGPYRLGRHVEHDARSLRFAHGVLPSSAIQPVQWTRRVPVFDQGDTGSCTGQAAAGLLGTDSAVRQGLTSVQTTQGVREVNEGLAMALYGLATTLDSIPGTYPPDDTGSSSLAAAKALQQLGLATGYTHGFGVGALKSALQDGPVMLGVLWLNSMFQPSADGTVTVDPSSPVAGGHELIVAGWDGGQFRLDNSWGAAWGDGGSGYITEADMAWLLNQQGDVTVPALVGTPTPDPAPVSGPVSSAELAADIRELLAAKGV